MIDGRIGARMRDLRRVPTPTDAMGHAESQMGKANGQAASRRDEMFSLGTLDSVREERGWSDEPLNDEGEFPSEVEVDGYIQALSVRHEPGLRERGMVRHSRGD